MAEDIFYDRPRTWASSITYDEAELRLLQHILGFYNDQGRNFGGNGSRWVARKCLEALHRYRSGEGRFAIEAEYVRPTDSEDDRDAR